MNRDLVAVNGHYAGVVTRFGGFLVDVVVIMATFAIGGRLLEYLLGVLLGHPVAFSNSAGPAEVALGAWAFLVIVVPLATGGRTIGMGVVGLRAVRADGQRSGRPGPWSGRSSSRSASPCSASASCSSCCAATAAPSTT